jgi:hypothetical protein
MTRNRREALRPLAYSPRGQGLALRNMRVRPLGVTLLEFLGARQLILALPELQIAIKKTEATTYLCPKGYPKSSANSKAQSESFMFRPRILDMTNPRSAT